MTRFAVDAPTALRLSREQVPLGVGHQLVGPGSLRSEMLAGLYRRVRAGDLQEGEALALLDLVAATKMRLLGRRGT